MHFLKTPFGLILGLVLGATAVAGAAAIHSSWDATAVHLTGDQTAAGAKTWTGAADSTRPSTSMAMSPRRRTRPSGTEPGTPSLSLAGSREVPSSLPRRTIPFRSLPLRPPLLPAATSQSRVRQDRRGLGRRLGRREARRPSPLGQVGPEVRREPVERVAEPH